MINKKSYNSHTDPLFRSSKILKIQDLYNYQSAIFMFDYTRNKRPPGLIAPLLRFWHLLGNPPKNTTKGRDLIFNEGIRLLNMADTSLDRFT